MTIEEIKEKIKTPEYDFLRTDPHLGDRIMLLGLGGSYAYGTNIETSDLDVRGITLNSREELLTNVNFEQFTNTQTDTVIYSFNKMISLLSNMNPNTIEIVGLEPWQYLYISPLGQELLNNKDMFISKKCVHTFGGYANAQLYRLTQISAHELSKTGLEKHILKTLQHMQENFTKEYSPFKEDGIKLYIDKSDREDREDEIFMDVRLSHYPLRDYLSMWNTLKNVTSEYNRLGKRNKKALEHNKISKHQMHLVRLYLMCFDILEKHEVKTYRDKDHDFLMEIRNGKYITEDNQVLPEFFEIVDEFEKRLEYDAKNTDLPENPDYKRINEFMADVNMRAIQQDFNNHNHLLEDAVNEDEYEDVMME